MAASRSHFWDQLSKLLQSLPGRNMAVLGMDANTQPQQVPGACCARDSIVILNLRPYLLHRILSFLIAGGLLRVVPVTPFTMDRRAV